MLLFALLPQMHERYLVFAAGISAIAIGANLGMGVLHLLITAIAWTAMLTPPSLRGQHPAWLADWYPTLMKLHPMAGSFLVLLCAAIFLYLAAVPRRRLSEHRFDAVRSRAA